MKKITAFLTAVSIIICTLAGCGGGGNENSADKIKIVTTAFSAYDWVKNILGDKADSFSLKLLNDNGADMHSYQPTTDDVIRISECDLFIYVGGESDAWVEDVLKTAVNRDMQVINMLEAVGDSVLEEEIIEGMEHDHGDGDTHEEEKAPDEHIWLSLRNAVTVCEKIAQMLAKIDASNADYFGESSASYIKQLKNLDSKYSAEFESNLKKTVVFADRFPFRYLTEDYGLEYYACFPGCSTESDASFDSVIFLASKIDELKLDTAFVIEGSDKKIAETVIENTAKKNQSIVALNSIQSVTADDIAEGLSYLSVMEENLALISISLK